MLQRWRSLNEWLRATIVAFVLLLFMHFFVLRFVTVRSTSMYSTLLPGDLLMVTRWNTWTGFTRGDVVVFRDPVQEDRTMGGRELLVKRIVGMPGDEVELKDGKLYVNGAHIAEFEGETQSHLVRLKKDTDPEAVLAELGLPPAFVLPGRSFIELPLNKTMADSIEKRRDVLSCEMMSTARGAPGHIFPFSPRYKWNTDDYGPIHVPKGGEEVRIDLNTLPLYDRIISRYEGNKLETVKNTLHVNGSETRNYTIQQDYYFVLGDSRHYSADSRFWGFVPADHMIGKAGTVILSTDPDRGGLRSARWFMGL